LRAFRESYGLTEGFQFYIDSNTGGVHAKKFKNGGVNMVKELDLKGKVVLVTGAKQGIGRCIANRFAECGADIAVMDLSLSEDEDVCKEIKAHGVELLALSGDVYNEQSVEEIFAKIKDKFGRCDILANNAGITKDGMSKKMTVQQFSDVINVNLVGSFICSQKAMALMREVGECGSIINFSSVVGHMGNIGQANYSASKAGLLGLTKTFAKEGARDKIRCNAVAPGFIETPMTDVIPEKLKQANIDRIPLKRIGYPLDVANAVLFLGTDLSSFITGQCININGGSYM
jgi:3-oxoacyl-[acyl-carrier protein] reductase